MNLVLTQLRLLRQADGGAGSVYRLFLPDLYYFQSSVKHGHQTYGPNSPRGHEGMYQVGNEESVAFFYAKETPGIALSEQILYAATKAIVSGQLRPGETANAVRNPVIHIRLPGE